LEGVSYHMYNFRNQNCIFFWEGVPNFLTGKLLFVLPALPISPSDIIAIGPSYKIPIVTRLAPGGIRGFSAAGLYVEGSGEGPGKLVKGSSWGRDPGQQPVLTSDFLLKR